MDIVELLRRPESKQLEFKRDLSSPQHVLRTIVAFANTAGGTLLVGVEDGTRRVVGVEDPLASEEKVANLVSDGIAPHLVPDVDVLLWRRTHVLGIDVYPSPTRPHYVKRLGSQDGVFVRVGSTNRKADPELIHELARVVRNESFDEQAMPELAVDNVDFAVVSEQFRSVRKLRRGDLRTLRLVTSHQGREAPTVGGVLLFGAPAERERHFPDAWIQVGRFGGTNKRIILDSAQIRVLPTVAVDDVMAFVRRNITRETVIGDVRHEERWAFPLAAIREAVINAIVHTDYSQRGAPIRVAVFEDRLEVESPGLLPFGLTVDDIRKGVSRLRNRVIGRVFHELRLVEQWGSGIQRMTAACVEAGLDPPDLQELGARFRVTIWREPKPMLALDDVDHAMLASLRVGEGLSTSVVAAGVGLTPRAVRTRLARLVEHGLVVEVGSGPTDPQRRYYLSESEAPR